jgi:hypothetical protein
MMKTEQKTIRFYITKSHGVIFDDVSASLIVPSGITGMDHITIGRAIIKVPVLDAEEKAALFEACARDKLKKQIAELDKQLADAKTRLSELGDSDEHSA